MAGRPWRRRRRAIIAGAVVVTLALIGVLSAAIWLPALRLQQISVSGLGYVEEQAVRSHLDPRLGDSVLLLPTDAIGEDLATVPGIESAQVERRWPDGMHVTVVESEPVAHLTRADGTVAVIDAAGEELPAAAAEGATLIPLRVGTTSQDPDGAAEAMTEVLAELPDPIRPAVQDMTATSPSDVTFTLALEDGSTKSVVWGDARDAELKGDVVQALIPQPGSVIDVSSPVAPVTR
ncbi:FtsQ-type POTRA domain-containing protein [Brachybacterium sp. Marseille-Q2903]|uniref:FtsQ-type POTRA domain-containing protein n=1 Tax=Brachybacterium epidermidis TaxID=2781983 RepID=A0ABR9W1R6_9MICO|nr:FtsQ-type POTRA domain-containing protein [Brachybacterium epidermidis]